MRQTLHRWLPEHPLRDAGFLAFGLLTGLASLALLIVGLVVVIATVLLIGRPLAPPALRFLRWWAGVERRRVARWSGTPFPDDYLPLTGSVADHLRTAKLDPAVRGDAAWLALHALTGTVCGLLTLALPLGAVNCLAVLLYWWALPADVEIAPVYPVTSWLGALGCIPIGLLYGVLAVLLIPAMARGESGLARRLLGPPTGAALQNRLAQLTESRAAALEAHGAELRRIERDLHDGTQNRLVAVVMRLGMAERALSRDPSTALPLIQQAHQAATDALADLRDVVRSVYPPILDERGLDGAIAALAARNGVPTTVQAQDLRRLPAAVESTAYFVAAESLTNVAKHSRAHSCTVRLAVEGDLLVLEVTDDGRGGADESGGSGLAGMRRRVEAFDGSLSASSPLNGPTELRMELPCGL